MKSKLRSLFPVAVFALLIASCNNNAGDKNTADTHPAADSATPKPNVRNKVITAEEQKALTPDVVLQRLKDGNQRYLANDVTQRDHSALIRDAAKGQYPMATVISCMDSRIPVEDVFDCSAGDLFVCRVAGNIVNEDILGSLEYGCKVSGAKLIVVLGHRYCGAIQSAVKDVKLGNITPLLAKIKPAIELTKSFEGEKTYSNEKYVTQVAISNVKYVSEEIKRRSPLLKEMIDKGELKIVSAGYDLNNGEVTWFNE